MEYLPPQPNPHLGELENRRRALAARMSYLAGDVRWRGHADQVYMTGAGAGAPVDFLELEPAELLRWENALFDFLMAVYCAGGDIGDV
jgi:hypothetical protein